MVGRIFLFVLLPLFSFADLSTLEDASGKFEVFCRGMKRPVQAGQVTRWETLGSRWVVGYVDEKPEGLFDLSYPYLTQRVSLGITGQGTSISEIKKVLMESVPEEELNGALENFKDDDLKLSPTWWKELPWKKTLKSEPNSFRLSDLKLSWKQDAQFKGLRDFLPGRFGLQSISAKEILQSFEFVKKDSGVLEMYWSPQGVFDSLYLNPIKVVDFNCKYYGLYEGLLQTAGNELLSFAADQIPVPVVHALVSAAINRFYRYLDLAEKGRDDMIMEHLEMVNEGHGPFQVFSNEQRDYIVEYILMAQTQGADILKWLIKKPLEVYQKDRAIDSWRIGNSQQWLSKKGLGSRLINPRFTVASDPRTSEKTLFLLAPDSILNHDTATVSIPFANPKSEYNLRIVREVYSALFIFGSYNIPMVGGIVRSAYGKAIEKPFNSVLRWESRLSAELENRNLANGEDWDSVLNQLNKQNMNPLELDREKLSSLMRKRKDHLRLP